MPREYISFAFLRFAGSEGFNLITVWVFCDGFWEEGGSNVDN